MPNVAGLLREEITRLSRKEIRKQVSTIRKASVQYRHHIAAMRRQVARLEREVALLRRRAVDRSAAPPADEAAVTTRFVAKGLRSHRQRIGLSAADYGRLAGVTAQTIYSWESKASTPRAGQRALLATLRGLGKREAQARLAALPPAGARPARKRARKA